MTRKTLTLALLLSLAWLPLQGLATPAEAAVFGFSAWGNFNVGGVHLALGVHQAGPYARYGPYYRFDRAVGNYGHRCSEACYIERGIAYHHYTCPVALQHFRAYGVVPPYVTIQIDPRGERYYRYDPPGPGYGAWGQAGPRRSPILYYPRFVAPRAYDYRSRGYDGYRGYDSRRDWRHEGDRDRRHDEGRDRGRDRGRDKGHDRGRHDDGHRHW
jgi:hypothetical protein